MTNALTQPLEADNTVEKIIPQNDPKWPSSTPEQQGNPRIVEVAFNGSNARKRESLNKPPRRVTNSSVRSREFLTEAEVEKLIVAAEKLGRHGHRDATIILVAYRHALRVSELCSLRWDQVDLAQGRLYVRRLKNGNPSTHPVQGPTIRALRRIQRDYPTSPLFSRASGRVRSQRPVFGRLSHGLAWRQRSHSRCIRTCSGTEQDIF